MKDNNPLVSIIIPTHNRRDLIIETLNSVVEQTYRNIELIIVDDHSNDNSEELIQQYIQKHENVNIEYLKSPRFGGCAARNVGFAVSHGQYIQFFDDDDLMESNHIEKKMISLIKNNCDFITCNYVFFDSNTSDIVGRKDISSIKHNAVGHFLSKALPTPSFLCSRECINKLGQWNENMKKLQDFSYFHRLFLYDMKGVFLNDNLFRVRVNHSGITSSSFNVEGYKNTAIAYQAVEREWRSVGGVKWENVKFPLWFLKFSVGRNMYNYGFKWDGLLYILKLCISSPQLFVLMLIKIWKYKTLHLTDKLIVESK